MLQTIYDIIFILLFIFGLVEFIKFIILKLFMSQNYKDEIMVLPMYGHEEMAEFVLRNAAMKFKWNDFNSNKLIICLDCGMDKETKYICNVISSEYSFMRVYNLEEFKSMLT